MEEQVEWIPFQEIDWDCPKNNVFWIDTRDFHAGYGWKDEPHADFDTLKKYPAFFHTKEELVALIERYYVESGGECEWRYFSLEGMDNWNLKYIRIVRTSLGFVVCDDDWQALNKSKLEEKVCADLLHG